MPHPFQCLLSCPQSAQRNFLVAACGSYIHVFDIDKNLHASSWPSDNETTLTKGYGEGDHDPNEIGWPVKNGDNGSLPPSKRQKRAPELSESSSAEIVVERIENAPPPHPPIVKLAATRNGEHVVAVTGEDKCIRVLQMSANGSLTQLSERRLPKRPCSISLTPDEHHILCADKFGDVYSLPLLGLASEQKLSSSPTLHKASEQIEPAEPAEPFVPSANSLTVHTKRNRNALSQQQKMSKKKPQKAPITFEHQLLLGHVSLLTDVVCSSLKSPAGNRRSYILTADRDEHIRISRGIPQSHIIEGYCLGHTQFVSQLCLIDSRPDLLVSGGGDDFLLCWDWATCEVRSRVDLKSRVTDCIKEGTPQHPVDQTDDPNKQTHNDSGKAANHLAVSRIVSLDSQALMSPEVVSKVLVALEGLPCIVVFDLNKDGILAFSGTYNTKGNVIDMAVIANQHRIMYSMDCIHAPCSTVVINDSYAQNAAPVIGGISFSSKTPIDEELIAVMDVCAKTSTITTPESAAKGKTLRDLLYGLESLRKRGADGDTEET